MTSDNSRDDEEKSDLEDTKIIIFILSAGALSEEVKENLRRKNRAEVDIEELSSESSSNFQRVAEIAVIISSAVMVASYLVNTFGASEMVSILPAAKSIGRFFLKLLNTEESIRISAAVVILSFFFLLGRIKD